MSDRGSRMHVLDRLERNDFAASISEITGMTVRRLDHVQRGRTKRTAIVRDGTSR